MGSTAIETVSTVKFGDNGPFLKGFSAAVTGGLVRKVLDNICSLFAAAECANAFTATGSRFNRICNVLIADQRPHCKQRSGT